MPRRRRDGVSRDLAIAARCLLVAIAIAALAGCAGGCGREQPHEVRLGIEQLASIAAEGGLVAADVADGRSKTTYVRVHGEELSAQAQHEAEHLGDAPVAPELRQRVQTAISLASDIGGAIDDVRTSPGDRGQARAAARTLQRAADRASKLAETLP